MLADADFAVRPAPHVWSRLEYACHVRDVHELFARRVRLMLDEDDPTFENWDQDVTADEQEYDLQDPVEVGTALVERAAEVAAVYAAVDGRPVAAHRPAQQRLGVHRETMGVYHLHDVAHHLWDVTRSPEPSVVPPGDL